MRDHTPPPDPELRNSDDLRHEAVPTTTPVGTFAAGQSPVAEFEVTADAPVGSFASGLESDADADGA